MSFSEGDTVVVIRKPRLTGKVVVQRDADGAIVANTNDTVAVQLATGGPVRFFVERDLRNAS